jgi:serine/threonine-protein kinase PknK
VADDDTIDLGIDGLSDATLAGRGGFASVYRANQPDFRRTVAVKILSAPETDLVARSRFDRECQAMGALSEHPNIVTLYDAGFLADGRAYLVMSFMEGGSLHELAHGPDKPSWQEVATIGTKLAGALETAHRAGILHRDIKPANVLISAYGEPQLTDFGIARIAGGHETTSSHITASLPYAPPEILDGQSPTPASDVYSLAATLVHLLTGTPPFTGDTDSGFAPLLRRVYEQEIPDLAGYGAPPALDAVLRTAMSKDPARRQRSAEELGRQIQQVQRILGAPVGEMVVAGSARDAVVDPDIPTVVGPEPTGETQAAVGPETSLVPPPVAPPPMAPPTTAHTAAPAPMPFAPVPGPPPNRVAGTPACSTAQSQLHWP